MVTADFTGPFWLVSRRGAGTGSRNAGRGGDGFAYLLGAAGPVGGLTARDPVVHGVTAPVMTHRELAAAHRAAHHVLVLDAGEERQTPPASTWCRRHL
ncbi:hypothetical protein [Streptomyces sp. NPDC056663]|uniref:hypothetical protein n=1 Tax=Streptomyces sp. NPDC056663 TaxID=3345899 RepID=UPI0036B1DE52